MVTKELFWFSRRAPKTVLLCKQESISSAVFKTALPGLAPGELCPCIWRQPPGIVSACRRDDLGVAKAYVTVKRITPFRSIPAVPQGRTRESIPGAWFGAAGNRISWQISPLNNLWEREKIKFDHLGKTKDLAATTTETRTGTSRS